jgi:putative aldouronate transport system substrate-binding protein
LPDDNTELGQIKTKVDRLWSETLKELLLAPTEEDFDEIWENFKEERQNLGYDRVMEEQTKRMEENKLRLGIQ